MKGLCMGMVMPVGLHVSSPLTNARILIKLDISVILLEVLFPAGARHLFLL
jgi:hypothetical protein